MRLALRVAAALLVPSASAQAQTAIHTFQGEAQFDFLGMRVDAAGDVDGDGFGDVVANALGYNPVGSRAVVWSGATGLLLHSLQVADATTVSGAGDVDGDGRVDLMVGDSSANGGAGEVRVFSGTTGALLFAFPGAMAKDYLGTAIDEAGDVDLDGFPDVVAGASQFATLNPGAGYALVISAHGGLLLQLLGDGAGDAFGSAVSRAGDVNQDGRMDVVIGAPHDDNSGADSGMARVYSGASWQPLHQWDGAVALQRLGWSVGGGGDVDQDGHDDPILGEPGDKSVQPLGGKSSVRSGATGLPLWSWFGGNTGSSVANAGDVDGDGHADVIDGGGSVAVVRSGKTGTNLFTIPVDTFSTVAGAGNVNGDCYADVIVGDPVKSLFPLPEVGQVRVIGLKLGDGPSLAATPAAISLAAGGAQAFALDAGTAHANRPYLLLGSALGTCPALDIGLASLPLVFDGPAGYMLLTVQFANTPVLANTSGVLDAAGKASAALNVPPGAPPVLAGAMLSHAYLVFGPGGNPLAASNPRSLVFVP